MQACRRFAPGLAIEQKHWLLADLPTAQMQAEGYKFATKGKQTETVPWRKSATPEEHKNVQPFESEMLGHPRPLQADIQPTRTSINDKQLLRQPSIESASRNRFYRAGHVGRDPVSRAADDLLKTKKRRTFQSCAFCELRS